MDEWGIPPTQIRRSPNVRGNVPVQDEAERSREILDPNVGDGNAQGNISLGQFHGFDGQESEGAVGGTRREPRTSGVQTNTETGGGENDTVFSKQFASLTKDLGKSKTRIHPHEVQILYQPTECQAFERD